MAAVQWYGEQLKKRLRKSGKEAANAAVDHLVTECKKTVDTPYPPASIPGMPPHKRTGTGQDAIQKETDEGGIPHLTVTEDGKHMLYLENGTRLMEPRPWFRPTLLQQLPMMGFLMFRTFLQQVFKPGGDKE